MEIILTGGGDSKFFRQIDRQFKKILPKKSNILLIPVATNRKNYRYCLRRIQDTFEQLEFNKIDVSTDLTKLNWKLLELFHALYIDGGNTFKLISEVRNSKFKNLLNKFLENGGILNADSAGAIILGKNIKTASIGSIADKNTIQIKKYHGLNILNNYNVHCHYNFKEEKTQIKNFSLKSGDTIALTEKTAIYIKNNKITVLGLAPLYIYRNGIEKIIKPKETFIL